MVDLDGGLLPICAGSRGIAAVLACSSSDGSEMTEVLRHLDMTIQSLRRSHPKRLLLWELEKCRATLVRLHFDNVEPASPDNVVPIRA